MRDSVDTNTTKSGGTLWLLVFPFYAFLPAGNRSSRMKKRMNQSEMIDGIALGANVMSCGQATTRLDMV